MIWEPPKSCFTVYITDLPRAYPQQLAHQESSHPAPLSCQPLRQHVLHLGGKFIKASKGGGPPQNAATAGPSSAVMLTPPKMEVKKRKKKRQATPKCTVTRETIPVVEKRPRVVPESPDSEAEGPFRDSDRTVSALENSPNTPQ